MGCNCFDCGYENHAFILYHMWIITNETLFQKKLQDEQKDIWRKEILKLKLSVLLKYKPSLLRKCTSCYRKCDDSKIDKETNGWVI